MIGDNTKFGYYCSIALHLVIVAAAVVSIIIKTIFKPTPTEPIQPFEMVEPSPEQPQEQNEPAETLPQIQAKNELTPIEPVEIPEPQETPPSKVQPEPTPPEPTPAPKPTPKKPKEVKKPKPAPKMSYADFAKKNPNVANRKVAQKPRTTKTPKIGSIRANTSNISNIANISTKGGTSAAMRNILGAYIKEIHRRAKSNWAVPTAAQNVDFATKIEFRIDKNGNISGLRIAVSSGNTEFDNSVMAAMRSISLPPPPDNEPHTVHITFEME